MPEHRRLSILIDPAVTKSLLDQRTYYNRRESGLGDRFYAEMLQAMEWLQDNYRTPPFVSGRRDIRRFITQGRSFQWLIYYRETEKGLVIPTIVHPSQRPRHKSRKRES